MVSIINKRRFLNNKLNDSSYKLHRGSLLALNKIGRPNDNGRVLEKINEGSWRGSTPSLHSENQENPHPENKNKAPMKEPLYEQYILFSKPVKPKSIKDTIVKDEKDTVSNQEPVLLIRQHPPRPSSPEMVFVHEAPPKKPKEAPKKLISIPGRILSPPPRRVIIEKFPQLPSKPAKMFIDRWLPYTKQQRKVVFEKSNDPDPVIPKPKNLIIEWEPPKVEIKKDIKNFGVHEMDPDAYVKRYNSKIVEPNDLPPIVKNIKPPNGVELAANCPDSEEFELVGDVFALSLIDLDREGLSEYKKYVTNNKPAQSKESNENGINKRVEINTTFSKKPLNTGHPVNENPISFSSIVTTNSTSTYKGIKFKPVPISSIKWMSNLK